MRKPNLVVRRGVWSMADQGLSSCSNLLLTLAVARTSDPTEFGAFSVAYLAFFLGLGIARALSHEPLLVSGRGVTDGTLSGGRAAAGAGVALGAGYAVGLGVLGAAVGGSTGRPLVVFAVCIPGLFLQDAWRYVLFFEGRPAAAAANDLLWCVLQVGAFALLLASGHGTPMSYLLAWGTSAALCAAAGVVQVRVVPGCRAGLVWIRAQRALGLPFAVEFLVYSGAGHVALLLIAAVSGLAGVGSFRALLALFGPLQVLIVGLNMAALSEGSRLAHDGATLRRALVVYSVLCGCLGLVWGLVLKALPLGVGTQLLGPTWAMARDLIVPTTLFVALWNATAAPAAGLRVLRAAGRSLRARVAACVMLLVLSLIGVSVAGIKGAVLGFAASQAIALVLWWREFLSAQREVPVREADGDRSGIMDARCEPLLRHEDHGGLLAPEA